jgi:hypothetical protein
MSCVFTTELQQALNNIIFFFNFMLLICLGIVKNEIFFYVLGCHKHKEEGEEED